ncbi:Hsp70 family protein [Dactylosporangium sp. CS-047395]|uniref:Hsp70 family protein n=1 Tax=Dactylosporangium sp. CS-047395 TaxID=3239936 RepID=UPI003D8C772D
MITVGYRLGIDYGTSNTAAVIQEPGGRTRPLLFDGFPQLPSSVCASGEGLLVGREAAHAARVRPECFEPHPKRRIDDGTVLLGDREYPVPQLIAAVLAQVRAEAIRTMGGPPAGVALTYPAAWAAPRRAVLLEAAAQASLSGPPDLVPEPVAAATCFAQGTGADVPVGSCVAVYDFGAGTFDASIVQRTDSGWDVTASDGLPDGGGLDVDAAIVAYLGAVYAEGHPAEIRRLDQPTSAADRRARRNLWEDVRTAKEILSRSASTYVHLPILDVDAPLGREQIERLAAPVVGRTVALTRSVIAAAVPSGRLAGLFLVGGSSRMPLVATLLHRVTGTAPTVMEQPELAVAQGSVAAVTAPSRIVRPRAEIRSWAAVLDAPAVSAETAAIVARPLPGPPQTRQPEAPPEAPSEMPSDPPVAAPARTGAGAAAGIVDAQPRDAAAGASRGGRSLFVAVPLLAGLMVMTGPARERVPEWEFWLGDALLYPGYAMWLAYLFAAAGPRLFRRLACHVGVLPAGCLVGYLGVGEISSRWGSVAVLTVLGVTVLTGAAMAFARRTERHRVRAGFGVADLGGLSLALAGFGAAHGPDFTARVTPGLALAGLPAVVAFVGAAAALGRYVAGREPGAVRWLPKTAAVLLAAGGIGTVVQLIR